MKKIVYLIGAGATQAEISLQGIEADITMAAINENVFDLSKNANGHYYKFVQKHGLSIEQDIELIMSLLEGYDNIEKSEFFDICQELRQLFRKYLISQIVHKKVESNLLKVLLLMHKSFAREMGDEGEKLLGTLTINYDSLLEDAYSHVFNGINCGGNCRSIDYQISKTIPPLLKLHGSFNWEVIKQRTTSGTTDIEISKNYEQDGGSQKNNGWIPPSVYKKPKLSCFRKIWRKANKLLVKCDILRVIGSSLRNEDWALISLIFTSQLKRASPYKIELIIPEFYAMGGENYQGVIRRLSFLSRLTNLSSLPIFERGETANENVFHYWLLKKIKQIEQKQPEVVEDSLVEAII